MAKIKLGVGFTATNVALPASFAVESTADEVDINIYVQILFFVIVIGICNHGEENLWREDDNNNPGDVDG